jgi:hypothetical protein
MAYGRAGTVSGQQSPVDESGAVSAASHGHAAPSKEVGAVILRSSMYPGSVTA